MAVLGAGAGRNAHTIFEVSKSFSDFTLLNVQIRTGRTHQIRVHLSHINHPVVGETAYGGGRDQTMRDPRRRRAISDLGRQFLHSTRLAFTHPRSGARLEFSSPLPPELEAFLTLIC
jgi:23S rRNA-/tRNA-specific pseudouridylate synthase